MVNQQKRVQQEAAYSAVVVNDHLYPCPYIVFDPKGVTKNDIGMDGDTYDYSLQLHYRQFIVALFFADLPSLSPSFHEHLYIVNGQGDNLYTPR